MSLDNTLIAAFIAGSFILFVIIFLIVILITGRARVITALTVFLILLTASEVVFWIIITRMARKKG